MQLSKSIYDNFAETAERHGDHTAVFYLGTAYSYSKVRTMAERFASALIDMGVTAGQKVMLYTPNSIQWVVSWLGIQKIGAIAVPITPIYTPNDVSYIANDSGAEAIICADTNFGYVASVLPKTDFKKVIVTKMADLLPWWKRFFGFLFDIIPRGKIALDDNTYSFRKLLSSDLVSAAVPADRSAILVTITFLKSVLCRTLATYPKFVSAQIMASAPLSLAI